MFIGQIFTTKELKKSAISLIYVQSAFSNNDLSAEYVTIHEFFHAYQSWHLDNDIYNYHESRNDNR